MAKFDEAKGDTGEVGMLLAAVMSPYLPIHFTQLRWLRCQRRRNIHTWRRACLDHSQQLAEVYPDGSWWWCWNLGIDESNISRYQVLGMPICIHCDHWLHCSLLLTEAKLM